MDKTNRALIILAAYDYEALQLTLNSLNHTLDGSEKVIIILNGVGTLGSAIVERISRLWASKDIAHRFVVRPVCSGAKAFYAIKEVLLYHEQLKDVKYICKIDDDVIALTRSWLDSLHSTFLEISESESVGFLTGLINNNSWGFAELLKIFGKYKEYRDMFQYQQASQIEFDQELPGIDNGSYGTIWQQLGISA